MRLLLSTFLVVAILAVGCGGGDDDDDDGAQPRPTGAAGTATATTTRDDAGSDGGEGSASLDPDTLPPPGEATFEVGGKDWVFLASDTLSERLFACVITEAQIQVNFQTDEHDLTLLGGRQGDDWFVSVNVRPREAEGTYTSSSNLEGSELLTEGQALAFSGPFDFSPMENPGAFEDVGRGRVAVNCP